jgi:hypothetical protein
MRPATLKPFFSYYGGKWRAAHLYPAPQHSVVVEPFAGGAGYGLRHFMREVHLYESDPIVAGLWAYLVSVSPAEILKLPVDVSHVDDVKGPQEARWLMGFWFNKGVAQPRKTPSQWMRAGTWPRQFWGQEIRARVAQQVEQIRHWKVHNQGYTEAQDVEATWFVDPPYDNRAGRHYREQVGSYTHLGEWCRTRRGQVLVCENYGAGWLPFQPLAAIKAMKGASREVLWTNRDQPEAERQMALL